ncbi:LysR substrate-binding domain-containing protein [Pseudomonas sp. RIT-PI-AD]|uniref:LysR substrate-binding domain-containing protein n=1 Tax=Pseudomonas sp. RIT-PI-AD TaxID=3035294 RepID=UPI0021DA451A|nr:LysR substrate-binding domain-containing protein [Pseudomonas sp. RIT-PI-AD]
MIDFRQLRYFVALAEQLHFGRAARRLNLTQPPLSRQIAALEAELGTPLLIRNSRNVTLTPAGQRFHRHARQLLGDLDAAVRDTRSVALGEHGRLALGFTMLAAWNVLPPLLKHYTAAHPRVELALEEVLPRDLLQALLDGRVDVGLSFAGPLPEALRYQPLYREALCVALPREHPLSACEPVAVGDLRQEAFIAFPQATAPSLYRALMACCRDNGFEPRIALETHMQQTIVNLVAEGLGVALVPDSMRKLQLPGVVFRALDASPLVEQGMLWHAGNDNPCLPDLLACARARPGE